MAEDATSDTTTPATGADTDTTSNTAADSVDGADQLGDAGKKALDAMKEKWRTERDARKALADELATLKTGADKSDKPGDQPDLDKLREQARNEARTEALKERALDKIEAKAAKLFADPEDAAALLASRIDDFIDDGKVDLEAIGEALNDLLTRKPHLAAQGARRFTGSADGGARNGTGPAQLTEQDLKRMKDDPEAIVAAYEKGQLNDLL